MSRRVLMKATKTYLHSQMEWDNTVCDTGVQPMPSAICGEVFVRIHPGQWVEGGTSESESLDEYFGLQITVSRRFTYAPLDRAGDEVLLNDAEGLDQLLERLRVLVHKSLVLMAAANALLPDTVEKFDEPLRFLNCTAPVIVPADWFEAGATDEARAGLSATMTFGFARRVQKLENMQ